LESGWENQIAKFLDQPYLVSLFLQQVLVTFQMPPLSQVATKAMGKGSQKPLYKNKTIMTEQMNKKTQIKTVSHFSLWVPLCPCSSEGSLLFTKVSHKCSYSKVELFYLRICLSKRLSYNLNSVMLFKMQMRRQKLEDLV
jgi:hypothetical protein